jgi:TonB family protein
MNAFLNYLIEANLGLIFFYSIYWLVLQRENQFTFKRTYLLAGVIASLVFPFFTIGTSTSFIPSLSQAATVQWLPEIVIYANGNPQREASSIFANWSWITYTYLIIAAIALILFLIRIFSLITLFKQSAHYTWKNYTVAESDKVKGVFSFFHFIFLSPGVLLAETEKQEILRHEEVHIKKLHSVDIILIQLLGIVFWFNPIIRSYKKSFVQVHEFEADARSVEGHDVDEYCSLLAKVALQNNGYVLANHFTNSFTLKRITMMKTVRRKIQNWKVLATACTLPLFFFVVACQDQVMSDIKEMGQNSIIALNYPTEVQVKLTELKAIHPKDEFIVIEMNEVGKKKLEALDADKSITSNIKEMTVIKSANQTSYVILVKGDKTNALADITKSGDEIFTIVEESAEPANGMEEFYKYIGTNLRYPSEAWQKGIEGRVFIEFVINTDGSISDARPLKGIGAGCDEEATRVIANAAAWKPGMQNGKIVRQRMVLPIIFKLGNSTTKLEEEKAGQKTMEEMVVVGHPKEN